MFGKPEREQEGKTDGDVALKLPHQLIVKVQIFMDVW